MAQILVKTSALSGIRQKIPGALSTVLSRSLATEVKPEDYGHFPDPIEHATGLEKKMLLARLAGDDRYEPKVYKRGPGTKDMPNLVPVHFEVRLCGCICEPDQLHINYFWLRKGYPMRCECGYWFKAVDADPESF